MNVDVEREGWLDVTRRIVVSLVQRKWFEDVELCHERSDPDQDALEKYARLKIRISALAIEQSRQEVNAGKRLGVLALLGREPEPAIRLALTLLVAKALSEQLTSRIDTVSDLAEHAVPSSNPSDILTIRQSFSRGGLLRPHCTFAMRRTLGSCRMVTLTEKAVGVMLDLPPSQALEFDVYVERAWNRD